MGEWGKWWSGRGRDQAVKCVFCGRNVPKHKAVQVYTGGRLGRDIYALAEVVSISSTKEHACISCAKHRHLVKEGIHTTERDKAFKKRAKEKREMDKVVLKVKEIERKEHAQAQKPKTFESPKPAPKPAEAPKLAPKPAETPKPASKPAEAKLVEKKEVPKVEPKAETNPAAETPTA